jgi:hypothetical protein
MCFRGVLLSINLTAKNAKAFNFTQANRKVHGDFSFFVYHFSFTILQPVANQCIFAPAQTFIVRELLQRPDIYRRKRELLQIKPQAANK